MAIVRGEIMSRKPRSRIRRRRTKPNYFLRTVFVLLLVVTALYFFLQSSVFNLKSIVVIGNKEISANEIIHLSKIKTGMNIFKVKEQPVLTALAKNPLISSVTINNRYPARIEINIIERRAIALVPTENGLMYVDKDLYCLKENKELVRLDLPIVTGMVIPLNFPLGKQFVSADLNMGLQVVKQLNSQLTKRISEINVKNNYISLFLNDGSQVRIGYPDKLSDKISLFDNIMKEENKKQPPKAIEYIDVSFEGAPVIKYKENW